MQSNLSGLALFSGGHNPFHAGPGAVLTDLIDLVTHSTYSHSGVAVAGKLYESTKGKGVPDGPQCSDLLARAAEYKAQGGHAWLFPLLAQFDPDWGALEATALAMIAQRAAGKLPYNVERLFGDATMRSWIFDVVAMPADGVIAYLAAHSKGVVCSEMAGLLLQGGGVDRKAIAAGVPWFPKVSPSGQPIGCSPQDIANMPLFGTPVVLA